MMTALCLPSAGSESEALPASGTDTVTIPRELYEQYRKMDTLMEILDVVEANYYEEMGQQPDCSIPLEIPIPFITLQKALLPTWSISRGTMRGSAFRSAPPM